MLQPPDPLFRPTVELLQKHDKPGPRYTSYPTALQFDATFDATAFAAALDEAAVETEPLSLYTHLPFCAERCLYCACNVVITRRPDVAEPYLTRVKREVEMVSARLGNRRAVAQFHLGGGTPTFYTPEQLSDLMDCFRKHFDLVPGAEIAVEVDPRVTTSEHLEALAEYGFNRMSLGVQDFDPTVQRAVHRIQSVEQTAALMQRGRALGYRSLNLDLIYGLPYQTVASFDRTMDQVIELAPDRLAVYSFALVPWLKHHQKLMPQDALPKGPEKLELLLVARERLLAAGYRDIGMDHFALPEDDLTRAQEEGRLWRNFMGYTARRLPDAIGFGVSAIGSLRGAYVQNVKKLTQYYAALDEGHLPVERGLQMDADDRVRRDIIQEWMCHFRIDPKAIERDHGVSFAETFGPELVALESLAEEGFVEITGEEIRALELGRLFPRNVAMVFDRYLRSRDGSETRFSRTV